ncbi:DUF397 domain-containing protein [Streptomyces stramineus]|uniref:DUF397 domain-containing protein n=1 Tax=Streptomyces TaxID=1883 RepID=UPI0031DE3F2F
MSARIQWKKSSFSGGGGEDCIELADRGDRILMRESDYPNVVAEPSRGNLATFLLRVKAGEFDRIAT